MIEIYDQVRKTFITPRIPDMDYVPTYDKSESESEFDESIGERAKMRK